MRCKKFFGRKSLKRLPMFSKVHPLGTYCLQHRWTGTPMLTMPCLKYTALGKDPGQNLMSFSVWKSDWFKRNRRDFLKSRSAAAQAPETPVTKCWHFIRLEKEYTHSLDCFSSATHSRICEWPRLFRSAASKKRGAWKGRLQEMYTRSSVVMTLKGRGIFESWLAFVGVSYTSQWAAVNPDACV